MVRSGLISIRNESSQLNISKGGSTSLYVDQGAPNASDLNDGFSWDRPYESIGGALSDASPWTEIWIKSGTYIENVVVSHQNIKLHGVTQDGIDRAVIYPPDGIPLTLDAGYCEVDGLALVGTNNHVLKANYPGHDLHDLYLELSNNTVTTYSALWFNDSDHSTISNSYFNGNDNANIIGIRVDGGSVDTMILGNYITGFGGGGGVGYAIGVNDAQRCAILPCKNMPNRIVDNYVGVYFYSTPGYLGHAVIHNLFAQQDSYDIYDPNVPTTSGIVLRENCYAYTGWMEDRNNDGIADIVVNAYGNYDHSPLSNPWTATTWHLARLGTT